MPTTPTLRQYALSDASLVQAAVALLGAAREDVGALSPYGVTMGTLDAVQDMRRDFANMESDTVWRGRLRTATTKKHHAEKALRLAIKELMLHARMKLGANTPDYHSFGTANLARMGDNALVRTGRTVRIVAREFQAKLDLPRDDDGNIPILANIAATTQQFDSLIDRQKDIIRRRDHATQARRKAGNALYSELSRLSSLGRALFSEDEARANGYRLGTSSPKTSKAIASKETPTRAGQSYSALIRSLG